MHLTRRDSPSSSTPFLQDGLSFGSGCEAEEADVAMERQEKSLAFLMRAMRDLDSPT